MATVLLSAATFLGGEGGGGGREREKKKKKAWGELGGFLIRVQIKKVTVICGHCLK